MLQALLAYLLAACGEERDATIPAAELLDRFPSVPADELEEHLSLLNLVNFGGGCYTVYAELRDGSVHVDKELWGDTFRAAPRLTPLEARAIRLALEYVGPMIAADAHTPLSRVRKKLEETFGQFELARTPEPQAATEEVDLVSRLARGMRERRLVEIEYQKEADSEPSTRLVEPYSLERQLPNWYVHTWDRTSDGPRSFRLDRMRSAKLTREKFDAREGFEPTRLSDARTAKVLYDKTIARWAIERGARPLADGSALRDLPVGSDEWLESEVLSTPRRSGAARARRAAANYRRPRQGAGEGARRRAPAGPRLSARAERSADVVERLVLLVRDALRRLRHRLGDVQDELLVGGEILGRLRLENRDGLLERRLRRLLDLLLRGGHPERLVVPGRQVADENAVAVLLRLA